MAQKTNNTKVSSKGEQLDLIDVGPENLKEIAPHARKYRKAVRQRIDALAIEVVEKEKIRQMAHAANLSRLPDGSLKFRCESMIITIAPRDEKVTVKEESEE